MAAHAATWWLGLKAGEFYAEVHRREALEADKTVYLGPQARVSVTYCEPSWVQPPKVGDVAPQPFWPPKTPIR